MGLVDHGVPVYNSRQWTVGLSPNAAGNGWNYIACAYVTNSDYPVEWAVTKNLTTSPTTTIYQTLTHHYPNTNIGYGTTRGQLRAPNGRIFFPMYSNRVAYYDPTTESVSELAQWPGTPAAGSNIPFSATFDTAGILYMASQSSKFGPSQVAMLDPTTLVQTMLPSVGTGALASTTYGYYIAADTITSQKYVYVIYGQTPWQVWAINITPGGSYGTTTKLLELASPGTVAFVEQLGQGWTIRVHTDPGKADDVLTFYWLLDGALYPYTTGLPPPSGAPASRSVTPASAPLTSPPDLDTTGGIGIVGWRANGSTGAYTYARYTVNYKDNIAIEALVPTSDGAMGNAEQYNGFFQVSGSADPVWYGAWQHISEGARINVGGTLYFAGYPNGALFKHDPTLAWDGSTNPIQLGSYSPNGTQYSGIKYVSYIAWSAAQNRLYCAGRRERTGAGSGIGYWDKTIADAHGQPFAGTFSATGMSLATPSGLAVDAALGRVIMPTKLLAASGTAQLFIFDYNLNLVAAPTVLAGLANLGQIFPTSTPYVYCGILQGAGNTIAMYHYNVQTQTFVDYVESTVTGVFNEMALAPDGTVWAACGTNLVQINVNTLTATIREDFTSAGLVKCMAFSADGNTLWLAGGSTGANLLSLNVAAVTIPKARKVVAPRVPGLGSSTQGCLS